MQQSNVQLLWRKLVGYKDSLPLYKIDQLRITDPRVLKWRKTPPILQYTGKPSDEVTGTVFELTEDEITVDDYEVDDYQRVKATLKSVKLLDLCCSWIINVAASA